MKFFDLVDQHIEVFALPEIGGRAHFVTQVFKKILGGGKFLPDLRQESGASASIAQDNAIHVRAEFGK